MTEKQFLSLMYKAGFGKPHGEIDFAQLSATVGIGLLETAKLYLKMGDVENSNKCARRAHRIMDKMDELGAFDFLNN